MQVYLRSLSLFDLYLLLGVLWILLSTLIVKVALVVSNVHAAVGRD